MFMTSLVLAALSLSPGQTSTLKLTNARPTFGMFGPTRPDAKIIPGDVLFLSYEIDGITISTKGIAKYSMGLEVVSDTEGKTVLKDEPKEKVDYIPLAGTKLPARAFITTGLDMKPGPYTVTVTVKDLVSSATEKLSYKFEVIKPEFGIVAVYASVDERGKQPTATTAPLGDAIFIHFAAVGFKRDEKKNPHLRFEMMPYDATGKATIAEPNVFEVKALPEEEPIYQVRFYMPMTRVGKFKVKLTATDVIAQTTKTLELPIQVVPIGD